MADQQFTDTAAGTEVVFQTTPLKPMQLESWKENNLKTMAIHMYRLKYYVTTGW
jgi:hypothetical protein